MPDTSVKWYSHAMPGAPVLRNVAGDLIAVLDACLVNGFGTTAVQSLVVSGNVATVTFAGSHIYRQHQIIEIAGVTGALTALNGQWRVTGTTSNALTFATTGIADGTASGTITCKVPALGWEKAFSGTNKAAYRSQDVTGTRLYLRVDDTGTTTATPTGYEAMTDVDTGSNSFSVASRNWPKSSSSTAREWFLVGDGRTFYFCVAYLGITASNQVFGGGFGDFDSWLSTDSFACFLTVSNTGFSNSKNLISSGLPIGVNAVVARGYSLAVGAAGLIRTNAPGYGSSYPSPVDSGFATRGPVVLVEGSPASNVSTIDSTGVARGVLRGALDCIPIKGPQIGTVLDSAAGYSGLAIIFAENAADPRSGGGDRGAFNLIGPW